MLSSWRESRGVTLARIRIGALPRMRHRLVEPEAPRAQGADDGGIAAELSFFVPHSDRRSFATAGQPCPRCGGSMFPEAAPDSGADPEPDLACAMCGNRSYAVAPPPYSEEVNGHARQRRRQPSRAGIAL